ncbi:MAG: hypothetical protein OXU51_19615 [Candidatus Poribacteria bacterium]|nr:hypothetical protein [Candidatus Poribacteria bacterium]
MANTGWGNVYKKLGARPVINAYTLNAGEEYIIANALQHLLRG